MTFAVELIATDLDLTQWTFSGQTIFTGAMLGLAYGILAVGLVLVYRSSRVINLAYGEIGALSAALVAKMVLDWDWPFFAALVVVVAGAALLSAVVELTVVRRLFDAPRVILLVATLGVGQLVLLLGSVVPQRESFALYPVAIDASFEVAGIRVRGEHVIVLVVVPLLTIALAAFLGRTRVGIAVRASASNADAATLAGISPRRMSTVVWTVAGALAGVSAVLVAPLNGSGGAVVGSLGPGLLLRALTAALIGGMVSMPLALGGGVLVGVVEAVLFRNVINTPSLVDMVLFVMVLVIIVARRDLDRGEGAGTGSWSFSPRRASIPAGALHLWWVKRMPLLSGAIALVLAVALPFLFTEASRQFEFSRMLIFVLVASSVTVLTGWAGQLSLGQFAFVGLGAMTTGALVQNGVAFELAGIAAAVVGIVAAIVIGLPSLRLRGLFLAVSTLAFAVATGSWLLTRSVFVGADTAVVVPRVDLASFDLTSQRNYYFVCLAVLVVALVALGRLRRSGIGRRVIAVRENEPSAAIMTVSPTRTKLLAFAISGCLCGVAGALFAGLFVQFGASSFPVATSLQVVTIAVIGGLGSIPGAILGTLWVIGLPALFGDDPDVMLLTSGAGLLVLLMYFPQGLVGVFDSFWARLLAWRARRSRPTSRPAPNEVSIPRSLSNRRHSVSRSQPALALRDISVHFGGIAAVQDVSLAVAADEVVGLIGANGAGKSTLMNAITGLVTHSGQVEFFGQDVTRRSVTARAQLGLGRTFQAAELFPDLTVYETVCVALEARSRTRMGDTILGLPSARRHASRQHREAHELIAFLGLTRFADSYVADLSTGTRRICELATVLALDAAVVCLDEPTAGLAQRESEAFGPLLLRLRDELGASLLVIEHDMPLIMSISDRVICLEAGRVISEGEPEHVRADPVVIASYLGTDERAVARSESSRVGARSSTDR